MLSREDLIATSTQACLIYIFDFGRILLSSFRTLSSILSCDVVKCQLRSRGNSSAVTGLTSKFRRPDTDA